MNEIVSRDQLVKQGGKGLAGVGGGIAMLALSGLAPVPSLIIGGIVGVTGLAVASSSKEDQTAGYVAAGAGALTALTAVPFIGGLAGTIMTLGGVGLLVAGGYSLYRFYKGMRSRQ